MILKRKTRSVKTVVVLGVARSGTSIVAGILTRIGVDMGSLELPSHWGPRGLYEDIDFVKLNEAIITSAIGNQNVYKQEFYWGKPPPRQAIIAQRKRFENKINLLVRRKQKNKILWGWKDPLTVLTIELYYPLLVNPYFIVVFRNNLSIAESMSFHVKGMSVFDGLRLSNYYETLIYNFLETHRDVPSLFVKFEDVISRCEHESERIAKFLGQKLDNRQKGAIKQFIIPRKSIRMEKRKGKVKFMFHFFLLCFKNPTRAFYYYRLFKRRHLR